MRQTTILISGLFLVSILGASMVIAGPLEPAAGPYPPTLRVIHEAAHDVDHAWEIYHRAALGGTVASPALQAAIEEHLHEARTLITQALEVAELGDDRQVGRLIQQVRVHTTQAIEGSKESKK